jgi:Uma2 family endonuclease
MKNSPNSVPNIPIFVFEMSAEGELLVRPPNYSLTGMRDTKILDQLTNWARRDTRGAVTDAASGFVLPNGARRSARCRMDPEIPYPGTRSAHD